MMGGTRMLAGVALVLFSAVVRQSTAEPASPAQLIGTWRGTSTCSDRVAAPACQDETVVYDFTSGPKPGTVHWAADKIVNGQRVRMGDMDLAYDLREACWKAEFNSPRLKIVWRLVVDAKRLTGTGRLLPGNETVRKLELRRE